jgi:hypothetical protein
LGNPPEDMLQLWPVSRRANGDELPSNEGRRDIRRNFGHWHRCTGMAEQPPSWLEATREHDMKREADEQGYTACCSKQHLLAAVICLICFCMRRPCDSAHSGCGYGLENGLVRNFTFVGGNRHSAIQDIESEPFRAANERPNGLPENCNFFGTTGTERRRTKRAGLWDVVTTSHLDNFRVRA